MSVFVIGRCKGMKAADNGKKNGGSLYELPWIMYETCVSAPPGTMPFVTKKYVLNNKI